MDDRDFRIAGINYEMGDFIVNPSPGATAARAALGIQTDANIQDILVATRELVARGLELMTDGVFVNALYRGPHQVSGYPQTPYVRAMPDKTVWEYTLTGTVLEAGFPDAF